MKNVSIDNTYWGGVFGLWTFTSRDWKKSESTYDGFAKQWLKNPSSYDANPTSQKVIVDFQVKPFIKGHRSKMLELCEKLSA